MKIFMVRPTFRDVDGDGLTNSAEIYIYTIRIRETLFVKEPDNQIKEDWFAIDFHPNRWIEIAIEGIGRGLPERLF